MKARRVLVYLGGMRAVRSCGWLASAICVGCAVLFLACVTLRGESRRLPWFGLVYAAAVAFAVVSRLVLLRAVALTRDGWLLVPLLGRAKVMPPLVDVYEQGDDVIVVGMDGQTTLLGVDRFPSRREAEVRRDLVEALRRRPEPG
jgi:hypothetical protein